VLTLPPDTRIFMATAPVDMRRSFDGLCAAVVGVLEQNPLTYMTYVLSHVRDKRVMPLTPDEFCASDLAQIG
jgi:hypothetical protein